MSSCSENFHLLFSDTPHKEKIPQAKALVFEINIMPSYSELEKVREHLAIGNIPEKDSKLESR
jgi:hypothetical protein